MDILQDKFFLRYWKFHYFILKIRKEIACNHSFKLILIFFDFILMLTTNSKNI